MTNDGWVQLAKGTHAVNMDHVRVLYVGSDERVTAIFSNGDKTVFTGDEAARLRQWLVNQHLPMLR